MSGCCVVVIVKGYFTLEMSFLVQMGDLYSKECVGWIGSACCCSRLYATIEKLYGHKNKNWVCLD